MFIPNGLYHFARHQLTYGSGQDRRFTYNFFERFGGYYGGTLNEFRVLLPAASCMGLDTIQCRQDAGATCVTTLCGEEES